MLSIAERIELASFKYARREHATGQLSLWNESEQIKVHPRDEHGEWTKSTDSSEPKAESLVVSDVDGDKHSDTGETKMTEDTPKAAKTFESVTCSRCAGTGHHSYCEMYGTTCFKCDGRGRVLTKRGAIASRFFTDLCSVPAGEIKVGDSIYVDGMFTKPGFYRVTEVTPGVTSGGTPTVTMVTDKMTYSGWASDQKIRKGQSKEDKAAKWKAAMEFQDTLLESGKPRKRGKPQAVDQEATDAADRAKREKRAAAAAERAKARDEQAAKVRADNAERAKARYEQEEIARKANAVKHTADNGWLINVLNGMDGDFISSMIEKLENGPLASLSPRMLEVLSDIYAKAESGARKGSNMYYDAVDQFYEHLPQEQAVV